MEIILSSQGFYGKAGPLIIKKIKEVFNKKNKKIKKIILISTAMKAYPFTNGYVAKYAKNVATSLQIQAKQIVITDLKKDGFAMFGLTPPDILIVIGGNTYRLQKYMQQWNVYNMILKREIDIYIGDSAGAIITGLNIDTAPLASPFGIADLNLYRVKDKSGLGLVPFSIWTDYRKESPFTMEKRLKNKKQFKNIFRIGLNEAYFIESGKTVLQRLL